MLAELRICGFALIEDLSLSLGPGLNVLTGETGAGKSMVISALSFVLGGRGGPSLVGVGSRVARVEAAFTASEILMQRCEEWGAPCDGPELTLARDINASGRNTYRLNGSLVTQAVLREAGELLVEIHGQHDQHGLLSPAQQLEILDRLGDDALAELKQGAHSLHSRWKELQAERQRHFTEARDRERQREWLTFEVEEIEAAQLKADELESLQTERTVLANADKIRQKAETAAHLLDTAEGGARTQVAQAVRLLSQIATLDPHTAPLATAVESVAITLDELCRDLSTYCERLEADPMRLEQINERLYLISRLQKKYGSTLADIVAYSANAREKLRLLDSSVARQSELDLDIAAVEAELSCLVSQLSQARRRVAATVEEQVAAELAGLEMKATRFAVAFSREAAEDGLPVDGERCRVGAHGADRIEFLISPNPGQPLQPLARIASGGEMSRIMLAIQSVVARVDAIPTMVFDEVDAGLGGVAAEAVAARLRAIAHSRQVLCVTHLPLVAAAASDHWSLRKIVRDGSTATQAERLNETERAAEIARMMAGKQATQTTLRQAEEMLGQRKRTAKEPTVRK